MRTYGDSGRLAYIELVRERGEGWHWHKWVDGQGLGTTMWVVGLAVEAAVLERGCAALVLVVLVVVMVSVVWEW